MNDQWIPVKDRLPEENQKVWVTNQYHGGDRRTEPCIFRDCEFYVSFHVTCTDLVKAWCPRFVPEPYKEVSKQ